MKKLNRILAALAAFKFRTALVIAMFVSVHCFGQENPSINRRNKAEDYGNTFNLGLGIGYYGYLGTYVPFIFADYEILLARHFTLAPFVGFSTFRSYNDYYYGNSYYYYQETIIPLGGKFAYYFDDLLRANHRWDFYLAASLGFVYDHIVWQDGYNGDMGVAHTASPLYLDGHIGARYHVSRRFGLYLDLSTGVSTIGISLHGG